MKIDIDTLTKAEPVDLNSRIVERLRFLNHMRAHAQMLEFKIVDELVSFFNPDGTYHNMMAKPVSGHDNLRRFIGGFIRGWSATAWEIVNIIGRGDLVVAERVDRTRLREKQVDLPCCGVFEMSEGRIKVWRDYFDLATYTRAAG